MIPIGSLAFGNDWHHEIIDRMGVSKMAVAVEEQVRYLQLLQFAVELPDLIMCSDMGPSPIYVDNKVAIPILQFRRHMINTAGIDLIPNTIMQPFFTFPVLPLYQHRHMLEVSIIAHDPLSGHTHDTGI